MVQRSRFISSGLEMMSRGHEVQMLKTLSRDPLGSIPSGVGNTSGLREPGDGFQATENERGGMF
jgi:hypothetical protein